jgi:phosphoribosylanthranilate isomerase
MRSIPIGQPGRAHRIPSLDLARIFEPVSDLFLTDTLMTSDPTEAVAAQPVAGFVGITGRTCDWTVARQLVETSPLPVVLAGGIDPENVAAGIRRVRPAGVDSCTGTNARDGYGKPMRFRKDPDRVRRMVTAARAAFETITRETDSTAMPQGGTTDNV